MRRKWRGYGNSYSYTENKNFSHNFSFFSENFFMERKWSENSLKSERLARGKAGGKVMRENEPVLLVLSVCDGEIILEKGEILCEKCQSQKANSSINSIIHK